MLSDADIVRLPTHKTPTCTSPEKDKEVLKHLQECLATPIDRSVPPSPAPTSNDIFHASPLKKMAETDFSGDATLRTDGTRNFFDNLPDLYNVSHANTSFLLPVYTWWLVEG
jgi:hypothetical protein